MATLDPVDIGSAANDGTGDPLRTAFNKLNSNDAAINAELATLDAEVTQLQNVSSGSKLLGRGDSGAGAREEITLGSGLSISGTTISASGSGLPTDDTNPLVQDPIDNTKRARIDAGAVGTGQTRAIAMGDRNVDLAAGGTFAELVHTHGIASITELASVASPTVIANVSGSSAAPSAVASAAFKTGFGFGALADKSQITAADISASGTPSASTFHRGDNTWASVIDAFTPEVLDLTDATTLTADHQRYRISAGAILLTKLRLRNSSNQANPVRITMPDADTITPAGIEFDLIQAHDQTGLCVVRPATNGSINGLSFSTTAVADAAWTSSSGATTTITSAANLPAISSGQVFEVRNHSTADNNGFYIATGTPTTSSITCTKLTGSNPANAVAEAVDIDLGFVALNGARATAVLMVDANPSDTPNARMEGETRESLTVNGQTTFSNKVTFDAAIDINVASTLDHTLTLGGSAAIVGGDKVASALELKDISETVFDAGNKSGAVTFDYRDGGWQFCTVTGNIASVAISNPPATGKSGTLKLEFIQDGAGGKTITWGAAFRFPGGTDFTLSAGAGDIDEAVLSTRDGGTTWRVYEAGKDWSA